MLKGSGAIKDAARQYNKDYIDEAEPLIKKGEAIVYVTIRTKRNGDLIVNTTPGVMANNEFIGSADTITSTIRGQRTLGAHNAQVKRIADKAASQYGVPSRILDHAPDVR